MAKSTAKRRPGKYDHLKPYPEFPLSYHPSGKSGRWVKRIRGKLHYFGSGDDPEGALNAYLEQRDVLYAGRDPQPANREDEDRPCTLADLGDEYLNAKRAKLDTGELTLRTFREYRASCDAVVNFFGRQQPVEDLKPADFGRLRAHLAKNRGLTALGNEINRIRGIFRHAVRSGLIDRPVAYGGRFDMPSKATMRRHRAENGSRMFSPDELRTLLDAANPRLRAMILLALNGGLGNTDLARLTVDRINFATGWMDFPRPKTGVERRIPLWPETLAGVRGVLDARPKPAAPEFARLVFLTRWGRSWTRVNDKGKPQNEISKAFWYLVEKLDLHKQGRGFYSLRHVFQTVGERSRDIVAVRAIMGHTDPSMSGVYREHIDDDRLQAVTDTVHAWLWPDAKDNG